MSPEGGRPGGLPGGVRLRGAGPRAWGSSLGGRHGLRPSAAQRSSPGPDARPVTSAGGPAGPRSLRCPREEPGLCGGPRRARAARGHRAISIRARERVAAAPGILLKAFSLFPAICSAPPGPGHVDNLFVEGKGGEEHRREEEMSLFTQPAFGSMGPSAGQREGGGGVPSLPSSGGGGGVQGSVRAPRGAGGGRVLWGLVELWSIRDPRPRPAAAGVPPDSAVDLGEGCG